jgi:tetratricopeptide (TPR) repeat protein
MTQARLSLGQIDQARAFIGDLERYHPNYKQIFLLKIQAAFSADEPEIALQESNKLIYSVERAYATNAENAQELVELRFRGIASRGISYLSLGDIEKAEKDLQEVVKLSPSSADAKINLARVYIAKNNLPGALELYQEALKTDEKNFDALSGTVSVLSRQKEFEKAKLVVDEVIRKTGNDKKILPALYYLKANIFVAENKPEIAEAELKKAIQTDENYLPAYSAYASLLITKNQMDEALAQYQKVVEKEPSASVYTLIGMLFDMKENFDESEKNYRLALKINPSTPIAANNLAWLIADQNRGNLDEALKLAQDTVSRNKNVAGYYDTLGWVNYKKGFYVQAVESFKTAVSLDTADASREGRNNNPAYRLRLGMALESSGDRDSARKEVAFALQNGKDYLSGKDIQNAKNILAGS